MTFMPITNPKVHFMQFSQHGVLVSSQRKSEDTLAASFPPLHLFHFIPFTGVTPREKPKSSFMQPFQHGDPVSFPNKREDAPAAFLSHTFVSHPLNHQHYTKTERQKQATEGTYEKKGFWERTSLHTCLPCLLCTREEVPRQQHHYPLPQLLQENQVVFSPEKMETRENVSTNGVFWREAASGLA
ncbi:hypothetical protein E4T42_07336 [Aureobasidium subglaciale]|nr:hypothetical protein E4T42_07336 [Aureobasidium subglaciale]